MSSSSSPPSDQAAVYNTMEKLQKMANELPTYVLRFEMVLPGVLQYFVFHKLSIMSLMTIFTCRRFQQRLPAEVLSSLASTLVKEPRTFELVRVLEKVRWLIFLGP